MNFIRSTSSQFEPKGVQIEAEGCGHRLPCLAALQSTDISATDETFPLLARSVIPKHYRSRINIFHGSQYMLGTILIIVLVLALLGALPTWGYSRGWGYFPSGGLGLVLLILIVLVLLGRV